MGTLQSKRFDEPDDVVTLPLLTSQVVFLGEVYVERSTHDPGEALAIRDRAEEDGLRIRAGVHSGEIERQADDIRGVAVHAAVRIAALAEPGEVLVSAPAASLLEGSDLTLEDAGEHELRGLPGPRRLHRVVG